MLQRVVIFIHCLLCLTSGCSHALPAATLAHISCYHVQVYVGYEAGSAPGG